MSINYNTVFFTKNEYNINDEKTSRRIKNIISYNMIYVFAPTQGQKKTKIEIITSQPISTQQSHRIQTVLDGREQTKLLKLKQTLLREKTTK